MPIDFSRLKLSLGHVVLLVADVGRSVEFYGRIGLPAFLVRNHIALIELRGGTHIILAAKDSADAGDMVSSRLGQMAPETGERFDLILEGNEARDLESYRDGIIAEGIEASAINDGDYFGHKFFSLTDPDGNVVSVYTSHEIKYGVV